MSGCSPYPYVYTYACIWRLLQIMRFCMEQPHLYIKGYTTYGATLLCKDYHQWKRTIITATHTYNLPYTIINLSSFNNNLLQSNRCLCAQSYSQHSKGASVILTRVSSQRHVSSPTSYEYKPRAHNFDPSLSILNHRMWSSKFSRWP